MTNIVFDLVDVVGEVEPGDTVRIWPPRVTRNTDGQAVVTRPENIDVGGGPVTRDVSPGPLWVQIQAGGYTDTDPKLVRVPEPGEIPDPITIADLLRRVEHYDPVLESWAWENAQVAEQAALDAIEARKVATDQASISQDAAAVAVATAVGLGEEFRRRIGSLETLGGLAAGDPVDGQTANLVEREDTLTRAALISATADIDFKRRRIVSVLDYGAVPDANYLGGTDNSDAFEAAYAATPPGGTLYVPPGNYWLSRTFKINRDIRFWCDWASTSGGGRGASNLFFPPGINGIEVGKHGKDEVRYMGWEIGPFQVVTSSVSGTGVKTNSEGIGIYLKNGGKGRLFRTRVEGFGSHGILAKAWSQDGEFKGNLNHLSLWEVTCTRNGGDGIQLNGTDVQRVTVMMPDVVGNHGWGINVENAHSNHIVAPHAAQNYYDSLGAFRDNAISTYWEHVYSEVGKRMLFDTNSNHAILLCSLYGKPALEFAGTAAPLTTLILDPQHGFYGQVKIKGRQSWNAEMRMGALTDETLDISLKGLVGTTQTTQTILSARAGNTDIAAHRTLRPSGTGMDLGVTWMKWQDGHFSRYVRAAGAIQTGAYETANRPTPASVGVGGMIFDTTTKKTLTSTGTQWVDAMGNPA